MPGSVPNRVADFFTLTVGAPERFQPEKLREKNPFTSNVVRRTQQARRLLMARSTTSFKPGNAAARTHGARSQKTGADTGSIRAQTLEEFPHLANQPELLGRLVSARGHVQDLRAYLDREGLLDGRGHPRKALDLLRAREKDVSDCLRLIQAGIPTLDSVEPWQFAQARLRARQNADPGLRDNAVRFLSAHGQPVPDPIVS
jgi:hypothetical protein